MCILLHFYCLRISSRLEQCLFMKFIDLSLRRHIGSCDIQALTNVAHIVDCLKYWQPTVFTNGTNGITNGSIGRTVNDIGKPLVPLLEPLYARHASLSSLVHILRTLSVFEYFLSEA